MTSHPIHPPGSAPATGFSPKASIFPIVCAVYIHFVAFSLTTNLQSTIQWQIQYLEETSLDGAWTQLLDTWLLHWSFNTNHFLPFAWKNNERYLTASFYGSTPCSPSQKTDRKGTRCMGIMTGCVKTMIVDCLFV